MEQLKIANKVSYTNKQLLKIWRENERQTWKGINAYENLTLEEKSRIFDLIAEQQGDRK